MNDNAKSHQARIDHTLRCLEAYGADRSRWPSRAQSAPGADDAAVDLRVAQADEDAAALDTLIGLAESGGDGELSFDAAETFADGVMARIDAATVPPATITANRSVVPFRGPQTAVPGRRRVGGSSRWSGARAGGGLSLVAASLALGVAVGALMSGSEAFIADVLPWTEIAMDTSTGSELTGLLQPSEADDFL